MARYRVLLVLLLLAWPAGCGASQRRAANSASQRRHGTPEPCRGELILIDARSARPGMVTNCLAHPDRRNTTRTVSPAVIQAARLFTVAVRGQRRLDDETPAGDQASLSEAGSPSPARTRVEGTGVVIDRGGLVLTNYHVVKEATDLEVWAHGVGWVPAHLVGADAHSDLAVISVDTPLCCAARLADADTLRVGQAVVALGHTPGDDLGTGPDTMRGVVTGLHQSLQSVLDPTNSRYYGDLLESTVPLGPGHSGGAVIDYRGAVVGLNTAAVTHRRTGRRSGYAIPMSAYVRSVIRRLARGGPVVHGYLGLLACACPADHGGVRVERLVPGGPAQRAGLQTGDTIVRLESTPVRDATHLSELVRGARIGRPIPLRVQRDRQSIELTCILEPHPATPQ